MRSLIFVILIIAPIHSTFSANLQCNRTQQWPGGSLFDCKITPTNEVGQSLGWNAEIVLNANVTNIWNAEIVSKTTNRVVIKNLYFNFDVTQIPSFGFVVDRTDGEVLQKSLTVSTTNGKPVTVTDSISNLSIQYEIQSWGAGGQIRAKVLSPIFTKMKNVTVDLDPCMQLRDNWGVNGISVTNQRATIEFLPLNSKVTPNYNVVFGFNFNGACSTTLPLKNPRFLLTPMDVEYTAKNDRSPMGTNLTGPVDWTTEYPFVNVFKSSRPWISGGPNAWDDGRPIAVDENGWVKSLLPNQVARTVIFSEMPKPTIPALLKGDYTVLYDGEGQFEYAVGNDGITRSPGRDIIRLNPANGPYFFIHITQTNPNNYLRNFRIILPGGRCLDDGMKYCTQNSVCSSGSRCVPFTENFEQEPFHPQFLKETNRYSSIRFMDFMFTNDSKQTSWSNRPKPQHARWSFVGVPVEIMARLCNTLKTDGWFNIPHLADNNYVMQFAQTLKANLNSDRKVYFEYSNEVWNSIMVQATYARDRGKALGLSQNDFEAQILFNAKRSLEVFEIVSQVFPRERLVRVLGSFSGYPWTTQRMLDFPNVTNGIDAIAIAPYFGLDYGHEPAISQKNIRSLSVSQFASLIRAEDLPATLNQISAHRQIIDSRNSNIQLLGYEGGQHLVGIGNFVDDPALNRLFDDINRSPEMGLLYRDYMNGWKSRGGDLFMHFVNSTAPTKWGRWGALEYTGQESSPKFNALMEFISLNPAWW